VSYSSVTEPISVDLDLDADPSGITAAGQDLTIKIVAAEAAAAFAPLQVSAPEPMLESTLEAEQVFEAALEIAAPLVEAALQIEEPVVAASAAVEPAVGAVLQAEQVFEDALEIAGPIVEAALEIQQPVFAVDVPAAAVDVKPVLEPAAEIDLVSEVEIAPAIEALVAAAVVELAPVAAAAEVVSIETGRTAPRSPVPALERLLTKVQARRAQLMAESVA
jgi:UDP-N-acetylmuramoylalanine--D-glutamate ligase